MIDMEVSPMNTRFEIVLCSFLPPDWAVVIDYLEVNSRPDGNTVLTVEIQDQAALYGLLMSLRDWGLTLVSVNRISDEGNKNREASK